MFLFLLEDNKWEICILVILSIWMFLDSARLRLPLPSFDHHPFHPVLWPAAGWLIVVLCYLCYLPFLLCLFAFGAWFSFYLRVRKQAPPAEMPVDPMPVYLAKRLRVVLTGMRKAMTSSPVLCTILGLLLLYVGIFLVSGYLDKREWEKEAPKRAADSLRWSTSLGYDAGQSNARKAAITGIGGAPGSSQFAIETHAREMMSRDYHTQNLDFENQEAWINGFTEGYADYMKTLRRRFAPAY